jgi:hypothetical protein
MRGLGCGKGRPYAVVYSKNPHRLAVVASRWQRLQQAGQGLRTRLWCSDESVGLIWRSRAGLSAYLALGVVWVGFTMVSTCSR